MRDIFCSRCRTRERTMYGVSLMGNLSITIGTITRGRVSVINEINAGVFTVSSFPRMAKIYRSLPLRRNSESHRIRDLYEWFLYRLPFTVYVLPISVW